MSDRKGSQTCQSGRVTCHKTCIMCELQLTEMSLLLTYVDITSWLVSAYDFYSRVVKNR